MKKLVVHQQYGIVLQALQFAVVVPIAVRLIHIPIRVILHVNKVENHAVPQLIFCVSILLKQMVNFCKGDKGVWL